MMIHRTGDDVTEHAIYEGAKTIAYDTFFGRASRLSVTLMRYHLEPGAEEGSHVHETGNPDSCTPDDSDELYIVISGELVLTVDGERAVLHAGDAVYVPAGAIHGVVNESDAPAELILAFGAPVVEAVSSR